METIYVFIDTEYYHRINFSFNNNRDLSKLIDAVQNNKAKILITEIIIREVKNHINNSVKATKSAIRKVKNEHYIIRNLNNHPLYTIYTKINYDDIIEQLISQFNNFIEKNNIEIVSLNNVDISKVVTKYFEHEPPFTKKKKSEFPDAINIEAISNWAINNNTIVYIISDDPDFVKSVEKNDKLICYRTISDLMPVIIKIEEKELEKIREIINDIISYQWTDVYKDIMNRFLESGFILIENNGEVLDISVNDIEYEENPRIISYYNSIVTIELKVTIDYTANIEYDDLETASYDSEDKRLIVWDRINKDIRRDINIDAIIEITIEGEEPFETDINDVYLDTGVTIEIELNDE